MKRRRAAVFNVPDGPHSNPFLWDGFACFSDLTFIHRQILLRFFYAFRPSPPSLQHKASRRASRCSTSGPRHFNVVRKTSRHSLHRQKTIARQQRSTFQRLIEGVQFEATPGRRGLRWSRTENRRQASAIFSSCQSGLFSRKKKPQPVGKA